MIVVRIAVSPDGDPWIITADLAIYRRHGSGWQRMPGSAMSIAAGSEGSVWAIGTCQSTPEGGHPILRWNGSDWDEIEGTAVDIAIGPDGLPWSVDGRQVIRRLTQDKGWIRVPGLATTIAVGPQGSVWCLGRREDRSADGFPILRWKRGNWARTSRAGVRLAVDPKGFPWVVNASNGLSRLTRDRGWQDLPGRATDIAIGGDGSVWAIGTPQLTTRMDVLLPSFKLEGSVWTIGKPADEAAGGYPVLHGNGILWRDPGPGGFASNAPLLILDLPWEQLRAKLSSTSESQDFVRPLLAEIERVYTRFIFRKPTSQEVARHLGCFYKKFPALGDRQEAVRASDIRPHLQIRPLTLAIDVTTQCNLRCTYCHFSAESYSKRKREDLSIEDFFKIAHEVFPFCAVVNLSCSVEPLLHPRLGDFVAIAKHYGVPSVGMTTNGLLFNEQTIEQVVGGGMDHVTISIDGATKATYERIRRKGNFDRLIANIRALNGVKERLCSWTPKLSFNFVMMRSNIRELPAVVRLAHELDVAAVTAIHLSPYEGLNMEAETMDRDAELCNRMLAEARAVAEKYHIDVAFPPLFDCPALPDPLVQVGLSALAQTSVPKAGDQVDALEFEHSDADCRRETSYFGIPIWENEHKSQCLFPWSYAIIDSYGDVVPCGWWGEGPMGNVRHESFEDIWNNDRYQRLRSQHLNGDLGRSCRNCPATGMGNVDNQAAFSTKSLEQGA
jgi:radical SAM protein with 4Fe4S-binding SPASM domain